MTFDTLILAVAAGLFVVALPYNTRRELSARAVVLGCGGFEANPLVAGLTQHLGQFRGVATSKLIAILIALGVRRLVWVINLFYSAVVFWNIILLVGLSAKPH